MGFEVGKGWEEDEAVWYDAVKSVEGPIGGAFLRESQRRRNKMRKRLDERGISLHKAFEGCVVYFVDIGA